MQRFVPFSAGDGPVILPVGSHKATTAICYEIVFPALAREAVAMGSELLTTVTNDGWYGRSSAPYQHWEMAAMRAIEQGRYLARAANTGISGIVDPYGRVVVRSSIFEQVSLVGGGALPRRPDRVFAGRRRDRVCVDRTHRAGGDFRKGTPWISMTCYGGMKTLNRRAAELRRHL